MGLRHPFQCLAATKIHSLSGDSTSFLLAAAGPRIHSYDLESKRLCGTWVSGQPDSVKSADVIASEVGIESADGQPPGKRVKLSTPEPENAKSKVKNGVEKAGSTSIILPTVISLAPVPDSQLFVAVTGEDKCIWVLQLDAKGEISPVSKR